GNYQGFWRYIFEFILPDGHLDPRWESQMLTRITLPFPLPLSWNPDLVVYQIGLPFIQVIHSKQSLLISYLGRRIWSLMVTTNSRKLAQVDDAGSKPVAKSVARRFNFTKRTLDSLPLPSNGQRAYFYDTRVRGLTIAVSPTGR